MNEYDSDELVDSGYRVVVNGEEQYSIWPADREIPNGWRPEGTEGDREACLQHIETVWTDMRPLTLRLALSQSEHAAGEH
ncbi:MAG: MbtH family NRPS accessory protein [Jatrophihabitantaceae bacterium]